MANPELDNHVPPKRTTMDRCREVIEEAIKARKCWSQCWHRDAGGETGVVIVENHERTHATGETGMVPMFYIVKFHNGVMISEQFI